MINEHLNQIGKGLDYYLINYDKILIIVVFNSEITESSMHEFCGLCNINSLCNERLCCKNLKKLSCIDLLLKNFPRSVQNTGSSDFYIVALTV